MSVVGEVGSEISGSLFDVFKGRSEITSVLLKFEVRSESIDVVEVRSSNIVLTMIRFYAVGITCSLLRRLHSCDKSLEEG